MITSSAGVWNSKETVEEVRGKDMRYRVEAGRIMCLLAVCVAMVFSASLCAASLVLEGNMIQGGLVKGKTSPGTKIEFAGRALRVSEEGLFLIGFGRDAPNEMTLTINHPDGTLENRPLHVKKRHYKIQRIDGLPPSKVTPKKKDLARIRSEVAMVKSARQVDDPRTDFLSGFAWPLKGRITGVYGSQRILNGQPRRPHYGIDIAASEGTPVRAPADGLITLTHRDMYYSGGTLILDHGHGLSSSFLHLKRILVRKGQAVRQGDVIAEVGATGRSKGAHLDWRINLFQIRLDPQLVAGTIPRSAK